MPANPSDLLPTAPTPVRAQPPVVGDGNGLDAEAAADLAPTKTLFDLSGIDLTGRRLSKRDLEHWNPHRGFMAMLDWVVWESDDKTRGIGLKHLRGDDFWVAGHFPSRPIFPGVLMIEAAAQLACYLYISRKAVPSLVAFLRIESASFRSMAVPGDDFYVLCQDVKVGRRRFVCDVQGLVHDRIAFDARISGMMLDPGPPR